LSSSLCKTWVARYRLRLGVKPEEHEREGRVAAAGPTLARRNWEPSLG
jgi:hypothetical protein